MSEISIIRHHGRNLDVARKAARRLADELEQDLDMSSHWDGDELSFERPGVRGTMRVSAETVEIRVRLGLLFVAFRPVIEREIHKFFDQNFPA